MTQPRRALRLSMYLCLCSLGASCTPLEPTRVIVPERDAAPEPGSPRDDAGDESARDGGDAATAGAGGSSGSGGSSGGGSGGGSGDAGDTSDDDGGASPNGRCVGDGEMIEIAAGDFLRGDQTLPEASPPQLKAVDGFAIDRTEVTVVAYGDCVEAGECTEPTLVGYCNWGVRGRDCHPINCVTWEQSEAYCAWADKRLPTETEWEFAACGPMSRGWPWGDLDPAGDLAQYAKETGTAVVGSYPLGATPEGLLDMAGNAAEWTSSVWCDSWAPAAPCDPLRHTARGGDWSTTDNSHLRTHYREPGGTEDEDRYGFRCAK